MFNFAIAILIIGSVRRQPLLLSFRLAFIKDNAKVAQLYRSSNIFQKCLTSIGA